MAWRYIKENHSVQGPSRIICLDTETHKENVHGNPSLYQHYLRCGVAIYSRLVNGQPTRRDVCNFDSADGFWRWLETKLDKRATTWIVAHKASFDWSIVGGWTSFDSGNLALDAPRSKRPVIDEIDSDSRTQRGICVLEDPPFILGLRHSSGARIVVVDTLNWFRCSLEELGKDIGLPKLEMPDEKASAKDWAIYNLRDAEIVEKAFISLVNFVRENDLGMFRYTAPSQAMAAFRHGRMMHRICKHDEPKVKEHERKGYYGGEVRLFFAGEVKEKIYYADVIGMFPFVMMHNQYPCKLQRWHINKYRQLLIDGSGELNQIATVSINSKHNTYPLRVDGLIGYVKGKFITTLCGPELISAGQAGDIAAVHDFAQYEMAELFTKYVTDIFVKRQEYKASGNDAYATMCKFMLNSLYGKFGQRAYRWQSRPDMVAPESWSRWLAIDTVNKRTTLYKSIGHHVFESQTPAEHTDNFPAIAAYVTSYAREYMRWVRSVAGARNVYYQGVDGLAVNSEGLLNMQAIGLMNSGQLGKLRITAEADYAEFRGLNNYTFGTVRKQSGLRHNAVPIKPGQWCQEIFENADGGTARQPNDTVRSWRTIFTQRKPTISGYCRNDGWIEPLEIGKPPEHHSSGDEGVRANAEAIRLMCANMASQPSAG